jgi:lysophospholipase L1-like esterase
MTATPPPRTRRGRAALLAAAGVALAFVTAEVGARLWVALRWPEERVAALTTHTGVRGRFASHAYLPFALNPAFPGHNSLGLRGPPIARGKPPGVRRLACIGASTTYGLDVEEDETYPARLAAMLREQHGPFELVNAGVPGWVSIEMLVDLQLRVLPLDPDVVVIYEGRNEVFPQAYNGFRDDYAHYRNPDFSYVVSNYGHKSLFRWSRLAMLLCTLRGERFGWSEEAEHPLYGGLMRSNRPSTAEVVANLAEGSRTEPYRRNLAAMVTLCRAAGKSVVLATMAFVPEKLLMNELDADDALRAPLAAQVARNNDVIRAVGRELGVPVVETAVLAREPDLFIDDCHMKPAGHQRQAELVFATVAKLLE